MLTLYPSIKAYAKHRLAVDAPHELYIEEVGNPDGMPILFLHSGPGMGCEQYHRRFFDPEVYRIILFDQRGSGRSTPHGHLEGNNTQALLEDIEKVREYFGIEQWMLFGGSWGATLAILYAQAHPERVMGLILRSIFLAREAELKWLYKDGANRVYPDYWEDFIRPISTDKRDDMINAYHELLTGPNELARGAAAKAWSLWETRCGNFHPSEESQKKAAELHLALGLARISSHYFKNQCFLEEGQLLNNMQALQGIPGIIVHGRYDMVCPVVNTWKLHELWPDSELIIVRDAGHSAEEPGIVDALVRATRRMAKRFKPHPDELS